MPELVKLQLQIVIVWWVDYGFPIDNKVALLLLILYDMGVEYEDIIEWCFM